MLLTIKVPPGNHSVPMQTMITTPDGRLVSVTIPARVATGNLIQVEVPDPPLPQHLAAAITTMQLQVPPGDHTRPQQIQVLTPRGDTVTVTIPAGVATGKIITISLPPLQPVIQAQPILESHIPQTTAQPIYPQQNQATTVAYAAPQYQQQQPPQYQQQQPAQYQQLPPQQPIQKDV
eukprot:c11911_g1_i1.p1 GENE.c11911_g1_i1~~c11911_g1_i1.p1  ORF type:complete len:185 (+),score=93.65 c11911_g1_i1:25-555(+)